MTNAHISQYQSLIDHKEHTKAIKRWFLLLVILGQLASRPWFQLGANHCHSRRCCHAMQSCDRSHSFRTVHVSLRRWQSAASSGEFTPTDPGGAPTSSPPVLSLSVDRTPTVRTRRLQAEVHKLLQMQSTCWALREGGVAVAEAEAFAATCSVNGRSIRSRPHRKLSDKHWPGDGGARSSGRTD